jgi:hypothetical protein
LGEFPLDLARNSRHIRHGRSGERPGAGRPANSPAERDGFGPGCAAHARHSPKSPNRYAGIWLSYGGLEIIQPLYVRQILHGSVGVYAWTLTAFALGGLTAGLAASAFPRKALASRLHSR